MRLGQQRDEIANDLFDTAYDDLANKVKPTVDKLVVEKYGEQKYRGRKGIYYEKRDNINRIFLENVQRTAKKNLAMGPMGAGYNPAKAKSELRLHQAARSGDSWGHTYDPAKKRTVGGVYEQLYDRDEEREAPEQGTVEELLDKYYNLIPDSTDENGKIDWEVFGKLSDRFWANLDDTQVDEVLDNIRVIEGEYPEEMQIMLTAGRYASAVRVNMIVDGVETPVSYWDIEELPEIMNYIADRAEGEVWQVKKYMDARGQERKYMVADVEDGELYERIGKELSKAHKSDTGILGQKKLAWMQEAPETWFMAMTAAGNSFIYQKDIWENMKELGYWSVHTEQPYDELYREALVEL